MVSRISPTDASADKNGQMSVCVFYCLARSSTAKGSRRYWKRCAAFHRMCLIVVSFSSSAGLTMQSLPPTSEEQRKVHLTFVSAKQSRITMHLRLFRKRT